MENSRKIILLVVASLGLIASAKASQVSYAPKSILKSNDKGDGQEQGRHKSLRWSIEAMVGDLKYGVDSVINGTAKVLKPAIDVVTHPLKDVGIKFKSKGVVDPETGLEQFDYTDQKDTRTPRRSKTHKNRNKKVLSKEEIEKKLEVYEENQKRAEFRAGQSKEAQNAHIDRMASISANKRIMGEIILNDSSVSEQEALDAYYEWLYDYRERKQSEYLNNQKKQEEERRQEEEIALKEILSEYEEVLIDRGLDQGLDEYEEVSMNDDIKDDKNVNQSSTVPTSSWSLW